MSSEVHFDPELWQQGPDAAVLGDPATKALVSSEVRDWHEAFSVQLKRAFELRDLLLMWDDSSILAWREVAKEAGSLIQRTLFRDLCLQMSVLTDNTKGTSSIVRFHTQFHKRVKPGPFQDFLFPLYDEIRSTSKPFRTARNNIIAHLNFDQFSTARGDKEFSSQWGSLNVSELFRLMFMASWYVNLVGKVNDRDYIQFEAFLDGTDEIKAALAKKHEEDRGTSADA